MLTPELVEFIGGGHSTLVGTRDADLAPDCMHAVGVRPDSAGEVRVFLPAATSAAARANLAANGRLAVTVTRAEDHHSVQLKGTALEVREASAAEGEQIRSYLDSLALDWGLVGVPRAATFALSWWPAFTVRMRVEAVFEQTPGPDAGRSIRDPLPAAGALAGTPAPPAEACPEGEAARQRPGGPALRLADLGACFQGVIPSVIATCDAAGEPNVTFLSQVTYVDPGHVALSCQFFNKTRRNVDQNPRAAVDLWDPRSFETYRLDLRLDHIETAGPLFETMAARIEVIASHTGMKGIFRLLSADVYRVESVRKVDGFLTAPFAPPVGPSDWLPETHPLAVEAPLSELRNLQAISGKIARAGCLETLLDDTLTALEEVFAFRHSMVLVPDDTGARLIAIGSRGYGEEGVGAEIEVGAGVFGVAASERRMVRVAAVGEELRYGRTIRRGYAERHPRAGLAPEIPLPGLPDVRAQLGLPLLAGDRLVGVLGMESRDPLAFDEWDEAFLGIVANQIALAIDRMQDDDADGGEPEGRPAPEPPEVCTRHLRFTYYPRDEVIFVGDEYLVRYVPAKILWRILNQYRREGRTEFTNQELRLDASLGLPSYRDNLESRLILLKKRLVEKCPALRMVPVRRGRFALEVDAAVELVERESA